MDGFTRSPQPGRAQVMQHVARRLILLQTCWQDPPALESGIRYKAGSGPRYYSLSYSPFDVISPRVSSRLESDERDAVRRLHADEDRYHHAGRRVGLQQRSLPRTVDLVVGKSACGIDSVYDQLPIIRQQHE